MFGESDAHHALGNSVDLGDAEFVLDTNRLLAGGRRSARRGASGNEHTGNGGSRHEAER